MIRYITQDTDYNKAIVAATEIEMSQNRNDSPQTRMINQKINRQQ